MAVMPILYIITKPGYYEEERLVYAMKQKSPKAVKEAYNDLLIDMFFNYFVFYCIVFCLFFFAFYYIIAFSGVYYYSSLGWISGGFISFIYYMFGIDFIFPLIYASVKKFADSNLRFRCLVNVDILLRFFRFFRL